MDILSYALSKKRIDELASGVKEVKVDNVNRTLTFYWEKGGSSIMQFPIPADGIGIKSIEKTSTQGLIDTYTVTYTDDSTFVFNIQNGVQGTKGDRGVGISNAYFNTEGQLVLILEDGEELAPIDVPTTSVDVSKAEGNIIIQKADGMYAPVTDLSSYAKSSDIVAKKQGIENAGKALIVAPNGDVTTGNAGVSVSSDSGNNIEIRNNGIYVPTPDLDNYVRKEIGKGLSENNLTNELKNKYDQAEPNVQSDFEETDSTKDTFIKNKPTKLSDFSNDEGFIKSTVNNLFNYYLKGEVYTKSEVDQLVADMGSFDVVIVSTLPETPREKTFYFVPKNPAEENDIYIEYIYINNKWEKIGTTAINLADYAKKTEIPTQVSQLGNDKGYTDNIGTVTSVRIRGTSPVNSSVNTLQETSIDTTISLAEGYGDVQNPYASKTKNYFLAAPSNENGIPSFRRILAEDVPVLNQNTTGTAAKAVSDKDGNEISSTYAKRGTSLSDYGITDVSITDGSINIAGQSITPITQHQSIAHKADKSETVSDITYDVSGKKLVKTINGVSSDVVTAATLRTGLEINNVTNVSTVDTATPGSKNNITSGAVYAHTSDTNNPHNVTKEQLGLGNVTNVATDSDITKGSNNNITSNAVYNEFAKKGIHYIEGTGIVAGTWLGSDETITEYFNGLTIAYKVPIAGASTTTLNINSLGALNIKRNDVNLDARVVPNTILILVCDGDCFRYCDYEDSAIYNASATDVYAYCSTSPEASAKVCDCQNFKLYEGAVVKVRILNNNTSKTLLTMNIGNTGAKAICTLTGNNIWTLTSISNYTLNSGYYLFYYNGTYWYALPIDERGIINNPLEKGLIYGQSTYDCKNIFVNGFKLQIGSVLDFYVATENAVQSDVSLRINLSDAYKICNLDSAYTISAGWHTISFDGNYFYLDYNCRTSLDTPVFKSAVCSTNGAVRQKDITISNYTLREGDVIGITFTNATTYDGQPMLSVNGGTAYLMCNNRGRALSVNAWKSGDYIEFRFVNGKFIMTSYNISDEPSEYILTASS